MTQKATTTRKWGVIVAILALCLGVGYAAGYLIGRLL